MKPANLTNIKSFKGGHTYFLDENGDYWLTDLGKRDYHKINKKGFITFDIQGRWLMVPLEGDNMSTLISVEEAIFLSNDGMRFDPNNPIVKAIRSHIRQDLDKFLA